MVTPRIKNRVIFMNCTFLWWRRQGVLNLIHRESHSEPSLLTPGQVYEVEVMLDATSWQFEPGHAIRLNISGAGYTIVEWDISDQQISHFEILPSFVDSQ
jgi:predicted acyl esterase